MEGNYWGYVWKQFRPQTEYPDRLSREEEHPTVLSTPERMY